MKKFLRLFILTLLSFPVLLPLYMLLIGSFSDVGELSRNLSPLFESDAITYAKWPLIPVFISFWSYIELLLDSPEFFVTFWNSIKLVGIILLFQLVISVPAAWGFAQFKFKGKNMLFDIYIILMLMPFQITMVSNYIVLDAMHLMNTLWAIIFPAAFSTFTVFIIYRFFTSIPKDLLDAAAIDGANPLKTFIHIGIPLGIPGIISSMTLSFLDYWNMIEQPMVFLQDQSKWPLSLYLPHMGTKHLGLAFVASVITLLPSLLVFLYGQNYLEEGILSAALKE